MYAKPLDNDNKMKKVLYLTNIEVPYRVRFFNELAKKCELTVMYERRKSRNRDAKWSEGEKKLYTVDYLDGKDIGDEYGFSFKIISLIKRNWDVVVIGCYNSKVQMLAMAYMRLRHIPFFINLDGEPFIGTGLKAFLKKQMLKGACAYLTAGVKAGESIRMAMGDDKHIIPYYFSSLTDEELARHACLPCNREKFVLVVGQYFDYKGMDVAFKVARMDSSVHYKFVGMGKRTKLFMQDMVRCPENIEIIPFLQKADLEVEYQKCALLLLPTRQECWGLVVNEAASFGTPIVSTWGSGAAVEFLADKYPYYLAHPGDAYSIFKCIKQCLNSEKSDYSAYLKSVSGLYSIERSIEMHLKAFEAI